MSRTAAALTLLPLLALAGCQKGTTPAFDEARVAAQVAQAYFGFDLT